MDNIQKYSIAIMSVQMLVMLYSTWTKKDFAISTSKYPAVWAIGIICNVPIIGRVFGGW